MLTDPTTLFWLQSFSLLFLLFTSAVLLRNRIEFTHLSRTQQPSGRLPRISVCVPARNEENTIETLLQSICKQQYPNVELLVLDDHSTDATSDVIDAMQSQYPRVIKKISGQPKPNDWLGKPWACQQLAEHAGGELILFLDADTELQPGMLRQTAAAFEHYDLDMITVWPEQITGSFWERMLVPLIYYALLSLLPAIYVFRSPRWVPGILKSKIAPFFSAANGQCIGFRTTSYRAIGGHRSVKHKVVEDVELAKLAKLNGLTLRMFSGVGSISCRMYRSEQEIFNGLRKNFFAGFNKSIPLFLFMAAIHIVVYILPFILLPFSLIAGYPAVLFMSVACVTIILLHRIILAIWFNWNPIYGFFHPISVLWFQRLAVVTLLDHFLGRSVMWKDRNV